MIVGVTDYLQAPLEIETEIFGEEVKFIFFNSEDDLLRQIRPGIDGLVLSDQGYRGTFLPSVWESLPEPLLFLQHLKLKIHHVIPLQPQLELRAHSTCF